MQLISAAQILGITNGRHHSGSLDAEAYWVSTDTRQAAHGAVFFALIGENFDGNDYLGDAVAQGANVIVCERIEIDKDYQSCCVIVVKNSLKALQELAAFERDKMVFPVVGITGSNGKTSTKDFTHAILSSKYKTNATVGNLNNHIGLPLTVLSTNSETEAAVWEMGMNHPGEIEPLCRIAKPTVGIITNIGTAHIEYLGSMDAIAEEKGALARSLPPEGILILSTSCAYVDYFKDHTDARVMLVGENTAVQAKNIRMTSKGAEFTLITDRDESADVTLPVMGEHMVANALLAAGVGYVMGIKADQIAKALSGSKISSGRLHSYICRDVTIIDDTYNANPESVTAAINSIIDFEVGENGIRYLVLGSLAELGNFASKAYMEIGRYAAKHRVHVVSVGNDVKEVYRVIIGSGEQATHFSLGKEASEWLKANCRSGDVVLFKGSRSAAIEKVMANAFTN